MVKGLPPEAKAATKDTLEGWERSMSQNLQLIDRVWSSYPPLHAPMVSSHVGPGYGSLMVLGAMADHILGAYGQ